jgi:hypothetical protein
LIDSCFARPELTILVGLLALPVRVLLLLAGLLATALLLLTRLTWLLTRVLVLLARLLILVAHRVISLACLLWWKLGTTPATAPGLRGNTGSGVIIARRSHDYPVTTEPPQWVSRK